MKRVCLLALSFTIITIARAQYVNIPDSNFATFLEEHYPSCMIYNSGFFLDTSCSTVLQETTIDIDSFGVTNLSGIQYFKSLKKLICSDFVNKLPPLPASLTYLYCGSGGDSLSPLPEGLIHLRCSSPYAHPMILPASLRYLFCYGLNSSIALPNSLDTLITTLDYSPPLTRLPDSLKYFDCQGSWGLTSLPKLPTSLIYFNCARSVLRYLPALPNSLKYLDCSAQYALAGVFCDQNCAPNCPCIYYYQHYLTSLPTLPTSLTYLNISEDSIYCLPQLPKSLDTLIMDQGRVQCLPNAGTYMLTDEYKSSFSLPVCSPVYNINQCPLLPFITGSIFYDNNSNGIQDQSELYKPFVKLQFSNGVSTFTDNFGNYQVSAGVGVYTLRVIPPPYYKSVPDSVNYSINKTDTTIVQQNFALQPIANVDSLQITIVPVYSTARRGNNYPYTVIFSNIGTTTLSTNITIKYNSSLLTFNSSTNPSIINNADSLILSGVNLVPGQIATLILYFTIKSSDQSGGLFSTAAKIISNSTMATDSVSSEIKASYDPNDKLATPSLTLNDVAKGKGISYIIHFQNTGNDTAFNVLLTDTLSNLLDATTFQMVASSSPCNAVINGNSILFKFMDIKIPDSNTNESASHGFVEFTVKPLSSVKDGNSINNKASIYFDYNLPVETNTATTLIQDSNSIVPLKLISFNALTPNTSNVLLYWNTTSEINTRSFNIEQSTDGVTFTSVVTVPAKGLGGHSYSYTVANNFPLVYYRLKMIDNNGQFTYSTIIKIKHSPNTDDIIVLNDPAKGLLTIRTNASAITNTSAKIINSNGAEVKSFILKQGVQTIDVSELSAGLYYIHTELGTKKVVISK